MSETRRLYLTTMGYVDLSEYLLKTEAETLYATIDVVNNKQDKLISGTNIKTVNGESILGSGNIEIGGNSTDNIYFTDFTVEDILSKLDQYGDFSTSSGLDIIDAYDFGKIICVPINNNSNEPYVIADTRWEVIEENEIFVLLFTFNNKKYYMGIDPIRGILEYNPKMSFNEMSIGRANYIGSTWYINCKDNTYYNLGMIGDYDNIEIALWREIPIGVTISFETDYNTCSISFSSDMSVRWANGELPEIEESTVYELSLRSPSNSTGVLAVLVPFKQVD